MVICEKEPYLLHPSTMTRSMPGIYTLRGTINTLGIPLGT
jgi:hypothetical protein